MRCCLNMGGICGPAAEAADSHPFSLSAESDASVTHEKSSGWLKGSEL